MSLSHSIGIEFKNFYVEYEMGSSLNIGLSLNHSQGLCEYQEGGCYGEISFGKEGVSAGCGVYSERGTSVPIPVGTGFVHFYVNESVSGDTRKEN